jgi:hypothetical protein
MRWLLWLGLVGCARPTAIQADRPPPALESCSYDVSQTPTLGQRRRIGFGYFPAVAEKLDVPMTSGGAKTELLGFSGSSTPQPRRVTSTDPSVVKVALAAVGGSLCQNQSLMTLQSGVPGQADVVLYDDNDRELDRVTVKVVETTRLELDRGTPGPLRFLAGSLQGVHATTLSDQGILVGTGAVHFTLQGSLVPPSDERVPPWWGGDAVAFSGTAGTGKIVVDGGSAHGVLEFEILEATAIDQVQIDAPSSKWPAPVELTVAAQSDGAPVFGAQCKWSWPFDRPEWVDGGWVGADPAARYRFTAPHAGSFVAVCGLPGREERVNLTFE